MFLVGGDDALHERVANHIARAEFDDRDALDIRDEIARAGCYAFHERVSRRAWACARRAGRCAIQQRYRE